MQLRIPKTILGRNVWRLRCWWNWNQEDLAREARVPVVLIRQIEHDAGDPKLSQLRALAESFKVDVAVLLMPGAEVVSVSELHQGRIRKKFHAGAPEECWLWRGSKRGSYGLFSMDGDRCYAHRLVYAMEKPLMMNWDMDHTCGNRLCVNLGHLKVVNRGTNLHWRDRRSVKSSAGVEA